VLCFLKKKENIINKSVSYEIDRKSRIIIEKYMKKMGIKGVSLGELLNMLGFSVDSKLYLKLDDESTKLTIYYTYENGNFNRVNHIYFDDMLDGYINVENKDSVKEYFVRYDDVEGKSYLENRKFVKRRVINGIEYYISLYNKELCISINNNMGNEIKFSCDGIKDKDKILNLLNDILLLEWYIFGIKLSDSFEDIFSKWIGKLMEIGFVNFSLSCINNKNVVSNCLISNFNDVLKVVTKSYFKKVYYERIITKKDLNTDNTRIVLKNGDYQFEVEYLDDSKVRDMINNEIELINYLNNLSFPVEIDDVCRNICRVSLGDINKYTDISLKVYRNDVRTNIFSVKDGKLDYFQKIDSSKRITIGRDGVFSYTKEDDILRYLVELDGDVVTKYEQMDEDGLVYNNETSADMYKLIEEAKIEKVRTRKLIEKLIKV